MGDLISVIVPVYNVKDYLDECMESICHQTYQNLEIILVDDGSTDTSGKLCDEWAKRDERIKVIHQENAGVSEARNKAIEIAGGKYLAFVDPDDRLELKMYEILMEEMVRSNASMVVCSYYKIGENGERIPSKQSGLNSCVLSPQEYMDKLFINGRIKTTLVVVWSKLYRRDLFEKNRFPKGRIHEDEAILHQLVLQADRISIIEEPLYAYRIRQGSIMRSGISLKKQDYFYAVEKRVRDCDRAGFPHETMRKFVGDAVGFGIRNWIQLKNAHLLTEEELKIYYNDVLHLKREYGYLGTINKKIIWWLFDRCPGLLVRYNQMKVKVTK